MISDYYLWDFEDTNLEVKKILKEKYDYVINEFNKLFVKENTKEYIIDQYNKVYIFENKYAIYIGVMSKIVPFFDKTKYKSLTDPDYLNYRYTIMIEDLVYDNDFNLDEISFISKCNSYFKSDFVKHYEVYQYFVRKYNGDSSNMFDNNDKFHTIAQLLKDKFDLYELLSKNQKRQIISDNYDISDVTKYYNQVLEVIKNEITNYSYKSYQINEYESVLLIEDTLVMYIGTKGTRSLFRDKFRKNGNVIDRYAIVIQELTYNEIFDKRKFSKFVKNIHILNGSYVGAEKYNNIYYRPFAIGQPDERITKGYHPRLYSNSNFDYVCEVLPNLNLKERYNNWKGRLRYFIVYEFNYNNKKGYAISSTLDNNPRLAARGIIKRYESNAGYLGMPFSELITHESWNQLMHKFVEKKKKSKWDGYKKIGSQSSILAGRVTYFIVPIYENNINIHEDLQLIEKTINKEFDSLERTLYDISEYKWKSEELMLECIKKVFKNKKVIHQYRPYFLHYKNGQLSYDVFVCGKDIAFEYQGEQHFKPIEIFGGEENFAKQQERDALKKELSQKNGITLIYINYWEDITTNLIKEKLTENGVIIK